MREVQDDAVGLALREQEDAELQQTGSAWKLTNLGDFHVL